VNIRAEITRHANVVERSRTNAVEWVVSLINAQEFSDWYGNEADISEELIDVIYSAFDERWSIEIMEQSQRYLSRISVDVKGTEIPTSRLLLIREKLGLARVLWLGEFAIQNAKLNNNMPVQLLQADFIASMPTMKITKSGDDRFVVGYSKYYGNLWKGLAKAVKGEYQNLSTWYTMQLMREGG